MQVWQVQDHEFDPQYLKNTYNNNNDDNNNKIIYMSKSKFFMYLWTEKECYFSTYFT